MSIVRTYEVKDKTEETGLESRVDEIKSKYWYTFQVYHCTNKDMIERFESLTSQSWDAYKLRMEQAKRQNGRYLSMDEILSNGVWPSTLVIFDYMPDGPYGKYDSASLIPRLEAAGYEKIYETMHCVEKTIPPGANMILPPNMTPILNEIAGKFNYTYNKNHPLDGVRWAMPLPGQRDDIRGFILQITFQGQLCSMLMPKSKKKR